MNRRDALKAAMGAALLAASYGTVRGQEFTKTVRIIVPNAPGGTSDILARLLATPLSRALGQPVIVENRSGAGGNIGADLVAKSRPDGHTLLLLDISNLAINPALYDQLPFDVERDLAPVTMVIYSPYILAVNKDLPVRDAGELVAYARQNSGKLSAANSGQGTLSHIVSLALASSWGTEMITVPYRGGAPSLIALAANEANLTMAGATQVQPYVMNGRIRGIAVSGPRRLAALPELPTFAELGWPMADAGTWQGVLVQSKTPMATIARLNKELQAALAEPAIKTRIAELGAEVRAEGGEAFRDLLRRQTEEYGGVIRANNIKAGQ
jgi:tripartite-type tricarboxylate transporter receptor subunit TctC